MTRPPVAMHPTNLRDIPEDEQRSPGGKFRSFCRNVSLAVGGLRNTGTWGGGHPFDVQIRRIPPGAAVCPFHRHFAQWELFVVRSGSGVVRAEQASHPVRAGDAFVHPPGEAHQLTNNGAVDLEVLIVADNPALDACYYPDSDKWGLRPPGIFFRAEAADYFAGEDPAPAGGPDTAGRPPPLPTPAPALPFAQRLVNLDDIPWEDWASPRGKFRAAGRQVSLALGARPRTPTGLGGHPFDLEYGRIAPGNRPCPFHSHSAQWEFYLFTGGRGFFRLNEERFEVGPGDVVLAPPGAAHDMTAADDAELFYFLVADNPASEFWHYPDSGKWGFNQPRKIFRPVEVDYLDGEE